MSLIEHRHVNHLQATDRGAHAHREGQLFMVEQGVVSVEIEGGRWVMPPGCLGWVPPALEHGAEIFGTMQGFSLYFDEAWSTREMPEVPRVVRVTPLLSSLVEALRAEPRLPNATLTHYLGVFSHAFNQELPQTLCLPTPRDARLKRLCSAMLAEPDNDRDLDEWAEFVHMTRRTLTRRFQHETGLSIVQWRQQMRLLLALEKLADGVPVTTVALDLGYSSASSFIAMFHRYFGAPPRAYINA